MVLVIGVKRGKLLSCGERVDADKLEFKERRARAGSLHDFKLFSSC